jgi:hypothetical protein
MTLEADILHTLTSGTDEDAWRVIIKKAMEIASKPLSVASAPSEVTKRDREIGILDHFLSTGGWELWQTFGDVVERTSHRLTRWWNETGYASANGKAVLILDGLSLRELPWLLQGAETRGFTLNSLSVTASELPGETNEFAHALGLGSRSQLQNNGGGLAHKLAPTKTECVDIPWKDCAGLIDSSPNWLFWHHWPDSKVHDGSGAGQGLDMLTRDAANQLCSDDFWALVERLSNGRRLVITSDHGYAATGLFFDASEPQATFLKNTFKSSRSVKSSTDTGPFVPPVASCISSPHGTHLLALGRWKWRSQGGYPTLAHGGLSLLEVLSPFVELSKS